MSVFSGNMSSLMEYLLKYFVNSNEIVFPLLSFKCSLSILVQALPWGLFLAYHTS